MTRLKKPATRSRSWRGFPTPATPTSYYPGRARKACTRHSPPSSPLSPSTSPIPLSYAAPAVSVVVTPMVARWPCRAFRGHKVLTPAFSPWHTIPTIRGMSYRNTRFSSHPAKRKSTSSHCCRMMRADEDSLLRIRHKDGEPCGSPFLKSC
jgi:hypothetical protein